MGYANSSKRSGAAVMLKARPNPRTPRAAMNIPVFCAAPCNAVPTMMMKAPNVNVDTRPNLSQANAQKGKAANCPMF